MPKNNNQQPTKSEKIKQAIELLKFAISLDDEEVIKSAVESVVEMLEEELIK